MPAPFLHHARPMMTPLLRITTAPALALRDEQVAPVDLQRVSEFAAVARKFVAATANKAALLAAWHELPSALQRRAVVIAQEHGIDRYFTALVGVPELSGSP
jgi:hypothetical protein